MAETPPTAVIALGRCDHGDAAAALMVADILEERLADDVTVIRAPTRPDELRDVLQRHDTVYAIDVMRTGSAPGVVRRLETGARDVAEAYPHHGGDLDLVDVVEAARRAAPQACEVLVFGIEGRWFSPRAGVSPEVVAAVHDLAERVLGAVTSHTAGAALAMVDAPRAPAS